MNMNMNMNMNKQRTREDLIESRTYINGELAISPYYYLRNGLLHVRYTVDRCMRLSPSEVAMLKKKMTESPSDKQGVLKDSWGFFFECVKKSVIHDGIAEAEKQMKEFKQNGQSH